jgi:hypothetical protein
MTELSELNGVIIRIIHNVRSHESKISLKINEEIYQLILKGRGDKLQWGIVEGYQLNLKGILDLTNKQINNPEDIWIKIK